MSVEDDQFCAPLLDGFTLFVDAERMDQLARRLGATTKSDHLFSHPRLNMIEHLVHEIGHALSVGIRPFDHAPEQISMGASVAQVLNRIWDKGCHNECLVLAAEATVLPRLGIEVAIGDLVDVGVDQGVRPWKLRAAVGSKDARKLACLVLRYIGRRNPKRGGRHVATV